MKNTFRVISLLEGLSFILLLFIATPIKYFADNDSYVKMLGMPHGILFLTYVVLVVMLKYELKWKTKTFWIILGASLVPFGTFYTEIKYLRN
jgi:integral membrane protein